MRTGLAEQRVRARLRAPIVRFRRARLRHIEPSARQMLDAVDYRRSMLQFMAATAKDPDILLAAAIDEQSTVVDAGAFVGSWAQGMASRYGCGVLAFEAVPAIADELLRRVGSDERITCIPVALGAADGHASMEYHGPGSRMREEASGRPAVEVEVRDVDAVLAEHGVDHVDLLMINIEGGEYDVLDRLIEREWLDRIDVLLVQFHEQWPGAPLRRRRIRRALRRTHRLVWNYPWVWERWERRSAG